MGEGLLTVPPAASAAATRALLADAGIAREASGGLLMAGVSLSEVAREHGTPTFVYNAEVIRARYAAFSSALGSIPHHICYAVKANSTLAVLRVLRDVGAGADIVSGGELHRALAAGFDPARIVFSGVGKTRAELDLACRTGVGQINVESLGEITTLGEVAAAAGRVMAVGIRVNPDVTTETHPYIATGKTGIKFGVPVDQVEEAAARIGAHPALELVAVAMHLGSQLLDVRPFVEGLPRLLALVASLRALGVTTLRSLGVGGGLGIRYRDEQPLDPRDLAAVLEPAQRTTGLTLQLEPGRWLVGGAGVMLSRVLYRKHSGGKDFVIVDAGMNDLVRPSHYQAYHEILEVEPRGRDPLVVDVVGPVCETGDFLALGRHLPAVEPGDLLAFLGAGAYSFAMGSHYNSRPRPAEILVDGGRWGIARTRETFDSLIQGEDATPILA